MDETKRCPRCKTVKPLAEFAVDNSKRTGRKSLCKECDKAKAASYYAKNPEKKAAYYQAEREEIAALRCTVRQAAERIYGGACEWCGATEGLEFDHVDDDGKAHREIEHHTQMFRRIVTTGERITDYQVRLLCAPCHRGPGWQERRAAHA